MGQTDELTLIASFRRRGIAIIATLAVISAVTVSAIVYNLVISGFAEMVGTSVSGFAIQAFSEAEAPSLDDEASLARFARLAEDQIKTGNFSAIRVIDPDGIVVFSTQSGEAGSVVELTSTMQSALTSGRVSSRHLNDAVSPSGDIVRSIDAPLRLQRGGAVVGILEIQRPYGAIRDGALRSALVVGLVVLIGGGIAIALLCVVVRRAERAVLRTRDWAESLSGHLRLVMTEKEEGHLGTVDALLTAVNVKDHYTAMHSLHVTTYACAVAEYAGWLDDVAILERAGLVHDIGKIGIAESILRKPGKLTAEERIVIEEHSAAGAEILEQVPFLRDVVPTVRHHHERWDGNGYPEGLAGTDVPRTARLMAIVDAYDAMTTERPYRSPLSENAALREIIANRGTQFDPSCVEQFLAAHAAGVIRVEDETFHSRVRPAKVTP